MHKNSKDKTTLKIFCLNDLLAYKLDEKFCERLYSLYAGGDKFLSNPFAITL